MEKHLHALRRAGHKLTPQRRAVLAALQASPAFPAALDIFRRVRASLPDISLDTVYRTLALLVEMGLVNQINLPGHGGNVFELVGDSHHHHHLICLKCGRAECLDYCPVKSHEFAAAQKRGFTVVSHSLEFYGYCRDCRAAN